MDRLHSIAGGGTAVLTGRAVHTQLLTGMGGVGKTQMAADYARTAWNDPGSAGGLDVLVWVTASARSPIVTGYAQAGVELCRADPDDPESAARSFLAWLTPKVGAKPCRWLIVLDDVADPADLNGLWPPDSPYGRTLITTRRRDAALSREGSLTIEVGLFTQDEALTYLATSLAGRDESADQLTALAADLGFLPLALAQAAAYLIDTGETITDYRDLLADRATTLASLAPDVLPDDQALPLAAAWSLSLDRADTLRPAGLARPMLQLASLLDGNGIPPAVLSSPPVLAHLAAYRTRASENSVEQLVPVSPRDAVRALRALHRLSLIVYTPTDVHPAVRVHQLIQRATRDTLTPHQRGQTVRSAADALVAAWPEAARDTDLAQTLRSNTEALNSNAELELWETDAHSVLFRVGRSLDEVGQFNAAVTHWQRLINVARSRLGPAHLTSLRMRLNLIRSMGQAGDAAGAVIASQELLGDCVRVLGEDDPVTLGARFWLAYWQGYAGEAALAADAFEDLLTDFARVFGSENPETFAVRHNIVRWRGEDGDTEGALAGTEELLTNLLNSLDPNHPFIWDAQHNIAYWKWKIGNPGEAVRDFQVALERRREILGPHHPDTLTTWYVLAEAQGDSGDPWSAVDTLEELIEHEAEVLGANHHTILAARRHLASWKGRTGKTSAAVTDLEKLLADLARNEGPHYPVEGIERELAYWKSIDSGVTLEAFALRSHFARHLAEIGRPDEAAVYVEGLLADMLHALGPEHPDTLTARYSIGHWRMKAADAVGALMAYEETLTHMERVLGPDHLTTLTTRRDVALSRGRAGDSLGAVRDLEQLVPDLERILGPDHPNTLTTRSDLGTRRGLAGDVAGAVTATEALLADELRVLGPGHPHVHTTQANLAYWRDMT
ncbi:tetratricopeptide repeat protein [Streptomyces scabiei]|uniref:tetratricopeptide repeat protein n=1 Tax=Streptomyces scabiei TaxID=1930 RepID=UPI0033CAA666